MTGATEDDDRPEEPLLDRRGFRRPIATTPGYHRNRSPALAGKTQPPIVLRETYVLALLDACAEDLAGRRLAAAIAVLWRTGVTVTEALSIRVPQVDLTPGAESVRINGTSLTDRRLALDPLATHYVSRWMELRRALPADHFLSLFNGPTSGRNWDGGDLRTRLKKHAAKVGAVTGQRMDRPPTPNDFRVTLAAELMVEQWPLPYIQTQLGLTSFGSFRELLPHLGIKAADQTEVMEIARTRPLPRP